MARKAVAIDPGSHTWKVLALKDGKRGLSVLRFGAVPAADGAAGLAALGIPLAGAVAGLAGRDMTLRYTQVPPSPDWQLRSLMDLEIQDIASQSGGALSADYNVLPVAGDGAEMDTILMALARDDALARVAEVVRDAGGSVSGHVPNCIALYNAYLRTAPIDDAEQVVCLANVGRETTDIALVRGHDLVFARNLSTGSKVLDEAIRGAFDVSGRKAESLKRDLVDLDPSSRGRYASGQAEKVTLAAGGAASVFVSGIQSSIAFCQSQTKIEGLRLDKVLLTGGGARLRGLAGMLREALHCPVETFDPFASVDLAALSNAESEQLRQMGSEAVIALGLAVSRVDPELYSLEILPEGVRRRRRFWERTIYNVGAAAIGVALLALGAAHGAKNLAAAETAHATVVAQASRLKSRHDTAAALVEQNAADRAVAEELAEKALPLHGLLRTLRALHAPDVLPPELWLRSVEVRAASRTGAARGTQGRPVVVVDGAIRPISGREVGEVYGEFSRKFQDHELIKGAVVVPQTEDADGVKKFTFTIDFMPEPEAAPPAEEPKR